MKTFKTKIPELSAEGGTFLACHLLRRTLSGGAGTCLAFLACHFKTEF
ncbi:MAG: hypothetical protein WCV67_03095 [Victivallaceae bacterium]|jgi:hypothetical protein